MEQIVKQTRAVGTSAGVLLPRSWLNKEVVVTLKDLSAEDIALNVFEILLKKKLSGNVKGIYLTGSYARDDYDSGSDVDILVITDKVDKLINYGTYEITLISEKNFVKNLGENLYSVVALEEAKTLLNDELIKNYRASRRKLKFGNLIKEIENVSRMNEVTVDACGEVGRNVPDATVYSIVLRLRELYLIRLVLDKKSVKNELKTIVGKKIYDSYLRVKRNQKEINDVSVEEALEILKLLKKWVKEEKGRKRE